MEPEKNAKKRHYFLCESCYFKCCKKSDYTRHLSTDKHSKMKNATKMLYNATQNNAQIYHPYSCNCGKHYNHKSSYYRHKKTCVTNESNAKLIEQDKDELIITLLKQNAELIKGQQDMMIKLTENGINNNHSHNNNNNKTFNLHFFLNETCKDAMNISDFVSNIKLELNDLEHTGRTSYVEGISNIIIKNLNNLEQHLRPLHCSDFKREVLYIKNNDEWLKETDNKPILTKTIKTIANENIKQINKWVQQYPDCTDSNSKKNDLYLKIVSNSMNGLTKEESNKNINKIISNVAKNVVIDK
jgi:hypothetical protein